MQPTARHAESGFTIIEFLVAILILSVGLLGLLTTLEYSMRYNMSNKMRDHSVVLAEQFLAEARSTSLNTLAAVNTTRQVQVAATQVTYTIVTTVTQESTWTNPNTGLPEPLTVRFEILVTWPERGVVKQHGVSALISNNQAS